MQRKRRTREHIIADLSVNHVERFILRAGHTAERIYRDYGYDLITFTFDGNGEIENDFIAIQLKATDFPRFISNNRAVSLTVESRDWEFWRSVTYPVILILFDAQKEAAYWIHVQAATSPVLPTGNKLTLTVHFPISQLVNDAAVSEWRQIKNNRT